MRIYDEVFIGFRRLVSARTAVVSTKRDNRSSTRCRIYFIISFPHKYPRKRAFFCFPYYYTMCWSFPNLLAIYRYETFWFAFIANCLCLPVYFPLFILSCCVYRALHTYTGKLTNLNSELQLPRGISCVSNPEIGCISNLRFFSIFDATLFIIAFQEWN